MYNPKDYQEKKQAVKRLTAAVITLAICVILSLTLTVLAIGDAQQRTRKMSDIERELAAADAEIVYLNTLIDNSDE